MSRSKSLTRLKKDIHNVCKTRYQFIDGTRQQDPRILKRRRPRKPTVAELQQAEDTINRLLFRMKSRTADRICLLGAKSYLFNLTLHKEL